MKISLKLLIISILCLVSYTGQSLYAMDYANPVQEKLVCILNAAQTDLDYITKGNKPYEKSLTVQVGLSSLTPDLKSILTQKISDFNAQYVKPHNLPELQFEYLLITSYLKELLRQSNQPIPAQKRATPAIAKKVTAPAPKIVPAKKVATATAAKVVQSKKSAVPAKKQSTAPVPSRPVVKQSNNAPRITNAARAVAQTQAIAPVKETIIQRNGTSYTICDWSNKVNKQTGATCAFHTLKNGKMMLDYLTGKIDKYTLENQLKADPNSTTFPLAAWQNYIGRTDNLTEDELRRLAIHANFPTHNLAIIQNISMLNNTRDFDPGFLMMKDTEFKNLCKAITAKHKKEPLVHVFALGTMTEFTHPTTGTHRGANGHWICIVLHIDENQKITLHTFDSALTTGFTTKPLAQALIKLLALDPEALIAARVAE